ncbi:MAG: NUDIX domain-containing protein [Marmoricola sp.]
MSAQVYEVSPGVLRLTWTAELQQSGIGATSEATQAAVAAAFAAGAYRIEALLDPDDQVAHRIAIMTGLMREGIARGIADGTDRALYARLSTDPPIAGPGGFRMLLNSFLPRKRAIGQMLIRDQDARLLLCELTYKQDFDLPGGVVEVGESPREATAREITEELGLEIPAGDLIITDWLPPWGGWDDAVCLVFDGGVHDAAIADQIVKQAREIKAARFLTLEEAEPLCADFTFRRIQAALTRLEGGGSAYTESGLATLIP